MPILGWARQDRKGQNLEGEREKMPIAAKLVGLNVEAAACNANYYNGSPCRSNSRIF